jgi:hypothetical protein
LPEPARTAELFSAGFVQAAAGLVIATSIDLPLRPTTHLNQPNGFGRKFLPEPSLRLAHEMLLFPSEELSTFPRQVQSPRGGRTEQ